MIPLVVRVEDLEGGIEPEQYAFIKSPVRIGRGDLNDLPLPRSFVSTYHGLVQFDEDSAHYVDVGSTNGSVVAGVRVERNVPVPLAAGVELLIGTLRLTFSRRPTPEHTAVPKHVTAFALRASSLQPRIESEPAPSPPQPTKREPTPPEPAALAAADAAIDAASLELDLQYASYRGAWDHMRAAVEEALVGLDAAARSAAVDKLAARYPAARAEPQFVALGGRAAAPAMPPPDDAAAEAPGAAVGDLGAAALRLLTAFGESYLGEARLQTGHDVESALARVADVLETFARSFVELRRGYEEFGSEMGVRTVQGEGLIHRARDARQLLSYLLDARGEERERELQRAFAEFMLHQVALLRGVVEGGRALLDRMSPDEISARAPKGVWPMRAAALWRAFEGRFHEFADEESALTEVLFGKEFARAYAAIVGQGAPGSATGDAASPARRTRR